MDSTMDDAPTKKASDLDEAKIKAQIEAAKALLTKVRNAARLWLTSCSDAMAQLPSSRSAPQVVNTQNEHVQGQLCCFRM